MIEYLALSLYCFFVLLQAVYLLSRCKNGYHAVTMLLLAMNMPASALAGWKTLLPVMLIERKNTGKNENMKPYCIELTSVFVE